MPLSESSGERPLIANEVSQVNSALFQGRLAGVDRVFIGAIFHFNTNRAAITDIPEGPEELTPVHIPQAGQLWCMVLIGVGQDPDLVKLVLVDANILRVHMDQSVGEFADRLQIVHLLPDHV